jgi:alcohol dehydrogenase class IV
VGASASACPLAGSPMTFTGSGYSARLGVVMREAAAHRGGGLGRILVVSSPSFGARWWHRRVMAGLRRLHLEYEAHDGMPTPESVTLLAARVSQKRPDAVLAIGGGSVLDAAKCAAALAGHPRLDPPTVRELCRTGIEEPGIPVTAVPTTPGTGAEATPFATVWDRGGGHKLSLRGPGMTPVVAVLDPDLLVGLPQGQTESCMLDALAQALEASWSTRSGDTTQALTTAALARLSGFLARGTVSTASPDERAALMLAGHYAGRAIATAGTTLCHALSYPMTLRYGTPHGYACGVTLASVLLFNVAIGQQDCQDPRGPARVRDAIARSLTAAGARTPMELAHQISLLVEKCSLSMPPELTVDAKIIAAEALSYDRAGNNPRRVGRRQLAGLVQRLPGLGEDGDEG